MSGTDKAYAATVLRMRYAMSGTDMVHAATRLIHPKEMNQMKGKSGSQVSSVFGLRYVRAMRHPILTQRIPNSAVSQRACGLRACYAMFSTETAFAEDDADAVVQAPSRIPDVWCAIVRDMPFAIHFGSDIRHTSHRAMRCLG